MCDYQKIKSRMLFLLDFIWWLKITWIYSLKPWAEKPFCQLLFVPFLFLITIDVFLFSNFFILVFRSFATFLSNNLIKSCVAFHDLVISLICSKLQRLIMKGNQIRKLNRTRRYPRRILVKKKKSLSNFIIFLACFSS